MDEFTAGPFNISAHSTEYLSTTQQVLTFWRRGNSLSLHCISNPDLKMDFTLVELDAFNWI
jgi:hypothetical protein